MTKFTSSVLTVALGVTVAGLLAYAGQMALNYWRTKKAEGSVAKP